MENKGEKSWVLPEYGARSIVEIPRFVIEFFDVGGKPLINYPVYSGIFRELGINKDKKNLVVIIIDGLGYELFKKLKETGVIPFLSSLHSTYITSTFPSTTATALVSLSSGLLPSEHGILGFKMFMERPYAIMNTIFYQIEGFKDVKIPIKEDTLMAKSYIYEALARNKIEVYPFLKKEYINSPFSKLVYGYKDNVPHINEIDLVTGASKILNTAGSFGTVSKRKFISLYISTLDSLSHTYGPYSEEVSEFMHFLDGLFERYFSKLMSDTLFLISADHGHIETYETNKVNICEEKSIRENIIGYPAGEPRAMYLNVRHPRDLMEEVKEKFSDQISVLSTEEVEKKGFWGGKLESNFRTRVGNIVLIPKGNYYIVCEEDYTKSSPSMKGRHGGLSIQEMLVPLIYND